MGRIFRMYRYIIRECIILVGKPERKRIPRYRREDNIKLGLKQTGYSDAG
jgi:hypothetical protein